jgi:L-serine dehydratase
MEPSIFNDVIGPVMRGPSSSHTAAAHRIGTILRQLCPPEKNRITVEFDRNGSLATTFEGQGSAMGLISGLAGRSILDPDIIHYKKLPEEHEFNIDFRITDYKAPHPNTYKIRMENIQHEVFELVAVSTGGGMIEVISINGFEVSIRGDFYETLICCTSRSSKKMEELSLKLEETFSSRPGLARQGKHSYLFNIKSRTPIRSEVEKMVSGLEGVSWIRQIDPVLPVLSDSMQSLPFTTIKEMLKSADEESFDLATMAIKYESARAGIDQQKVLSLMTDIALHIKHSIDEGLKDKKYDDRILGHQSHLILQAEREGKVLCTPLNTMIAYVTAIMESKSSMGIIVAAPTAGSCGVLGGALFGIMEHHPCEMEAMVKAFLAAGLIGVFIANKYTFAAEEGGCQVECGAASAMAAAGLVQLMGGDARQAVNAASMALQNCLGMICDPVADRVEVPCLGKNILAATNALNSANMSMAGFDPVIPLDEVIDAMKSVGEEMPRTLCCTGLGGLSLTPASKKLQEKRNEPSQNQRG